MPSPLPAPKVAAGSGWRRQAFGALLVSLAGIVLLWTRLGLGLERFSYDSLFIFSLRPVPTNIVLIKMDEKAQRALYQSRGAWDRGLHAGLVDKLRQAQVAVFDVYLTEPGFEATNALLAAAMVANGRVILSAELGKINEPGFSGRHPIPPLEVFVRSAAGWGLHNLEADAADGVVRHLFPGTDADASLPWVAAAFLKAPVTSLDREAFFKRTRWMRYYGDSGALPGLNYASALQQPPAFFRDKIVFIGGKPRVLFMGEETDEFPGPLTRWTGENLSGMDIHATALLNLIHRDWLTRLSRPAETLLVCLAAGVLVFGLNHVPTRWILAAVVVILLVLTTVTMVVNLAAGIWFGWATVAGVQLPAACLWTLRERRWRWFVRAADSAVKISGHTLLRSIGRGAYGEVWLARDVTGRLHAVKVIHRSKFPSSTPFDREFRGIQKFTPISRTHPGFVHILHVDQDEAAGYFYYVMEVGDDERNGQRIDPGTYVARTLASELRRKGRLLLEESVELSIALASALEHLHGHQLIHRDIKPSNIIFVNNTPKLADIGLVTDIGQVGRQVTYIGTEGYMPPEGPGTPAGDVYSLGKVIYEAVMGKSQDLFPELPSTLLDSADSMKPFFEMNEIIIRACAPDLQERYRTAAELRADLTAFRDRLAAARC